MTVEQKIMRLEKRHKGLSRVTAAINDLYIYGVYESNFPDLMEKLNEAKDAVKEEFANEDMAIKGKEPIDSEVLIDELKIVNIKYKLKEVLKDDSRSENLETREKT